MTATSSRARAWYGLAMLGFVSGLSCQGPAAQRPRGQKYLYQVPSGVRGWVKVAFSSPACSALEDSDGHKVIEVSEGGTACTKHSSAGGWNNSEVRYADSGPRIPEAPDRDGCCQPAVLPRGVGPRTTFVWWDMGWTCENVEVQSFFIGTADEYNENRDGWQKLSGGAASTKKGQ